MKKISIFFAAAFFFFVTSTVNADSDDYKNFYIGAGGSYGIFDGPEDFDNSWGINAKTGYHLMEQFAVQFDYDYLWEFEDKDFFDGKGELDIMTYILSLKGNFPVKWYNVISPFIIVGGGVMNAGADFSETDYCGKVGGGFDFFLTENFSVNLEGNYTHGFGSLKDIRYFHSILGVVFRFDLPHGNHEFY